MKTKELDELIEHFRERRQGVPEGDLRDPAVLEDVFTMLLDMRVEELASRARGPSGGVYDSLRGKIVFTEPGTPAPNPRDDRLAGAILTIIGYVRDLPEAGHQAEAMASSPDAASADVEEEVSEAVDEGE
jgi:hypothetical protein